MKNIIYIGELKGREKQKNCKYVSMRKWQRKENSPKVNKNIRGIVMEL